jgi:hypothetical protein
MKGDFVNRNSIAFLAQLKLVKSGLPGYATLLGVDPDDVTAQAADCDYFEYCLRSQNILHHASREATNWKDLMRNGGQLPPTGSPLAPVLPTAVTAVAPGIEARFRALVKQIKTSKNYNAAIGQALGIEGAQQTPPDYATLQPAIRVIVTGNAVLVEWGWQGYSAWLDWCELQVDRGDGHGFVPLTFDTTPGYTDNQPFPATPTKWTYRAIYRVGDAQVGVWSPPVSVNVP